MKLCHLSTCAMCMWCSAMSGVNTPIVCCIRFYQKQTVRFSIVVGRWGDSQVWHCHICSSQWACPQSHSTAPPWSAPLPVPLQVGSSCSLLHQGQQAKDDLSGVQVNMPSEAKILWYGLQPTVLHLEAANAVVVGFSTVICPLAHRWLNHLKKTLTQWMVEWE